MGILATDEHELIIIYSGHSYLGKEILIAVKEYDMPIREINIENEKIADTVWVEISDRLHKPLGSLFSPEHATAADIGDTKDFDTEDWIKIIDHNPSLLQHPIIIKGDDTIIINEKNDLFSFLNPSRSK